MENYLFKYSIKARFTDVDVAGIVHHSNFFSFLEEARLALLESGGYSYSDLKRLGALIIVTDVKGSYKIPVSLGETLTIFLQVSKVKNFSLKLQYEIVNEKGKLVFTGETVHAFIDAETKELTEIPPELMELFKKDKI